MKKVNSILLATTSIIYLPTNMYNRKPWTVMGIIISSNRLIRQPDKLYNYMITYKLLISHLEPHRNSVFGLPYPATEDAEARTYLYEYTNT